MGDIACFFSDYKPTIESLGLIGAAIFFAWKIFTGWLIINLQLSLELTRQHENNERDLLAIKLILKKGATDTLRVKDISFRIRFEEGNPQFVVIGFDDISRLRIADSRVTWDAEDSNRKKFTLSPDESVQFAKAARVPQRGYIIVEAAVYGDRAFWPWGFQWRVSGVSLPVAA